MAADEQPEAKTPRGESVLAGSAESLDEGRGEDYCRGIVKEACELFGCPPGELVDRIAGLLAQLDENLADRWGRWGGND